MQDKKKGSPNANCLIDFKDNWISNPLQNKKKNKEKKKIRKCACQTSESDDKVLCQSFCS